MKFASLQGEGFPPSPRGTIIEKMRAVPQNDLGDGSGFEYQNTLGNFIDMRQSRVNLTSMTPCSYLFHYSPNFYSCGNRFWNGVGFSLPLPRRLRL